MTFQKSSFGLIHHIGIQEALSAQPRISSPQMAFVDSGEAQMLVSSGSIYSNLQSSVSLTRYHTSNVPGIALYMTSLNHIRSLLATSPYFSVIRTPSSHASTHASVLPSLTVTGNLLAGATTRVAIGFLLNPVSVLKTRYEVRFFPPDN